jgi:two-component system, cell cycle sensor histidine kinase and response regulator CckA
MGLDTRISSGSDQQIERADQMGHSLPENGDKGRDSGQRWVTADRHHGQKRERVLEPSEALIRAVLDAALDAVITIDHDGYILEFNHTAERMFGFSRDQVLGQQMAELLVPPSLRERHYRGLHRFMTSGEGPILGRRVELSAMRSDGSEFPVELSINSVDLQGSTVFTGFIRDLSERNEAELAARQLAAVVEYSDDAIYTCDLDWTILTWNPGAERLYGYSTSEAVGQSASMLLPQDRRAEQSGVYERLGRNESVPQLESVRLRKDGSPINVAVTFSPIRDANGQVVAASVIARDITRRVEMEEALRISEGSYRRVFEGHPSPMWVYDPETLRFLAVNRSAVAVYGYSRDEFLAMTIEDIRPSGDHAALRDAVGDPSRGRVEGGIWTHRKKDGTLMKVSVTSDTTEFDGRPARLVLAADVTEQRRLEEQLRQSQKVEAIGSLAAGIAHDFNNILTGIQGYSALLLEEISDDGLRSQVSEISWATERASELTRQLLAFSRQQILHPEVIELNDIVQESTSLLERVIGEDIVLSSELDADTGRVFVDRGQLIQVILNLAVNARDAMPEGGRINIRTTRVELDEDYAAEHHSVSPGSHVLLQISDTGKGIDEAIQGQIFDPFFTTKKQGTGLGLSTVHGIVNQSGGHIWAYSEPGAGTTFKIYLPRHITSVEEDVKRSEASTKGSETILVVEDSSLVRPLVSRVLKPLGYTVLLTASAEEALQVARDYSGKIDLLLTDVVLPGKNGRELAEELLADFPAMKVLYTSGYPADMVVRHGIEGGTVAFIEKPYMPADLARKVRETIDDAPS